MNKEFMLKVGIVGFGIGVTGLVYFYAKWCLDMFLEPANGEYEMPTFAEWTKIYLAVLAGGSVGMNITSSLLEIVKNKEVYEALINLKK